jgi:hypothetical protein
MFPFNRANLELSIRTVAAGKPVFAQSNVLFTLTIEGTLKNVSSSTLKIFPGFQEAFQYKQVDVLRFTTLPLAPYKYLQGVTLRPKESYEFSFPSQLCGGDRRAVDTNSGTIPLEIRYNWHGGKSEFAHCLVKVTAENR